MTIRRKRTSDFELSVEITSEEFLKTPRPQQRDWIVNQALVEFSNALEFAHLKTPEMLKGGTPADLNGRSESNLAPDEIMEVWQRPVMQAMADAVCASKGKVLEIGFGRGIASDMIQEWEVNLHTIVECNPHIIADCETWKKNHPTSSIEIVEGLWQDVMDGLTGFDGIFFHTYPLTAEELLDNLASYSTFAEPFFEPAAAALVPGGKLSYYSNEASSLSRTHQRALFNNFSSFKLSKVSDLGIPDDSRDAHWFQELVIVEATL